MNLNLDTMDAEPAVEPPVETPTEPAAPPTPPIEPAVVAAAPAAVNTPVVTEPVVESPKVVPLATLMAERREWQEKLSAAKAAAAPPPAPPPPVDFMEDPKGYVDQNIQRAVNEGQATAAELQAFREQQQINALINEAGQAEAAFSKEHADYEAALEHVRSTRMAQLRLMDSEAPEAQLRQVIAREEIMGIASAKQRGINPAELAYNYAKTLGYRTPVAAPAAVPAVPATPVAAPVVAAVDVSAARSLGAGGGGGDATEEEESEITSVLKARFRR